MMSTPFLLAALAATAFLPGPEGVSPSEGHAAGVPGYRLSGGVGTHAYLVAPGEGKVCEFARPFTVEGWFRKTGAPDKRSWALAGCRDDANGWTLSLVRSGGQTRFRLFVSDVHGGGRLRFERDFPNAAVTGDARWRHAALVYDPRDGCGGWSLFLDGVWQGTLHNPCTPARPHGFPDLVLGGRRSFSNSFEGCLSGWRAHDSALAPGEVLRRAGIEPETGRETVADVPPETPRPPEAFRRWRKALETAPAAANRRGAPFRTPFGRLYVFGQTEEKEVAFTYSDDDGENWQAWCPLRGPVPAGDGAGAVFRLDGEVVLAFTNATFVSGNLLTERNAGRVAFRPSDTRFDPSLLYFGTNRVMRLVGHDPAFAVEGALARSGKIDWGLPEIFLRGDRKEIERICARDGTRWAVCADGAYRLPGPRTAGPAEPLPAVSASAGVALPETFGTWETGGFAIVLEADLDKLEQDAFLFSTFDGRRGVRVRKNRRKLAPVLQLDLPAKGVSLQTRPGFIPAKGAHRVAFVADYAARALFVVVDGRLQPGGARFPASARYASGLTAAPVPQGVTRLALFPRAMSVAEAAERTRK